MTAQVLRLPDGQTFTVTPVFAGMYFKSNELNAPHPNAFPIGWTVVLRTEEDSLPLFDQHDAEHDAAQHDAGRHHRIKSFTLPTLQSDYLFISSISNPSDDEFRPAASPSRHIAMMLYITLYWYFHQPSPPARLSTDASRGTPEAARPVGDWRIWVRRDGILRGRNMLPKLERMGLIASSATAVEDGWSRVFVSQRAFWQIPAQLFLFTLRPSRALSPFLASPLPGSPSGTRALSPFPGSPSGSRPGSPAGAGHSSSPGPFFSTSHLPTYYPPPPLQIVTTEGVRHPLRPKPHGMGDVFYRRFVPSVGQYLSFRVVSSNPSAAGVGALPTGSTPSENAHLMALSDAALLRTWMAKPRVSEFWGEYRDGFLEDNLRSAHSFPAIAMWDGVPFGYFEIYWVKEDILGRHVDAGDWDRGFHVIIGEEWARGRVEVWLSSLVHWCFMADNRTMNVCLEPRVDNQRLLRHLDEMGFARLQKVSFPHKQSWYVRMDRASWTGPTL